MILQYDDFRGGYWTGGGSTKLAAPETGLLLAENCEYFLGPDGKVWIRGRRGKKRLNTDLVLPGTVVSLWRLYRKTDGPFTLVGYQDGRDANRVYFEHDTDDNGLLETLPGGIVLDAGLVPQWVTVAEREACYGVTGGSGLLKYDGSTLSEVPLRGGAFLPTGGVLGPYITLHQQRLWVTDGDFPTSRIWGFALNSEDLIPATNDFLVEDPQGSRIVGLASWNEYLLIFKETAVFRLSGSPESADSASLVRVSPIGCVAPRSIQVTPDGVMYLSRDGLRITDGQHTRGLDVAVAIRNLFVSPGEQHLYRNAVSSYSLRKNQYRINLDGGDITHILQRLETLKGRSGCGARRRIRRRPPLLMARARRTTAGCSSAILLEKFGSST